MSAWERNGARNPHSYGWPLWGRPSSESGHSLAKPQSLRLIRQRELLRKENFPEELLKMYPGLCGRRHFPLYGVVCELFDTLHRSTALGSRSPPEMHATLAGGHRARVILPVSQST
ncbi:hypothetical protein CIHG_06862 [Coccidioides immitis H538.4]|uniref:Uncharacterized protein n=3 Tax=Coccidioides immitis TaxID=5501 RepID=A0A0J8QZL4_COCIT|nr:hypothetical protein CIRG_04416 [Coccidioides immitis RMSCC 2394]KMU77500.1 hypothetical protein CISG_06502 [Coccidioides immitis RMSCC 3703]KMU89060.1 hypothetical protein CIHG_06862 [Coccidioides immitis H538.4]